MRTWGRRLIARVGIVTLAAASVFVVAPPALAIRKDCDATSTGLIPLTDLGTDTYLGAQGGLYPGGTNDMPQAHLDLGLQLASEVVRRGVDGSPDGDGKVVMVSFGVSNTKAEFEAFTELVGAREATDPDLVMVNGAVTSRALEQWAADPEAIWGRLDQSLRQFGVAGPQVQVAWVMLPSSFRGPRTLEEARAEVETFTSILQSAKNHYPNLRLVYVSSRIYGGYIRGMQSEPNAYNHGFEMKWLIEDQITGAEPLDADPSDGSTSLPWIGWGPYLWADGINPRSDGLVWLCDDFEPDGVHPGEPALVKVADLLLEHFQNDPTARSWFSENLSDGSEPSTTTAALVSSTTEAAVTASADTLPGTTTQPVESQNPVDPIAAADDSGSGGWWLLLAGLVGGASIAGLGMILVRRSRLPD